MKLNMSTRLLGIGAFLLGFSSLSAASEPVLNPPQYTADPAIMERSLPCTSCGNAAVGSGQTCQKCKGHGKRAIPYKVNLCPGACFGYFPTQWHRWEEVCPIPYPGAGLSDAPRVPTAPLPGSVPATTQPRQTVPNVVPQPTNPNGGALPQPTPIPNNPGTLPKLPMPPGY